MKIIALLISILSTTQLLAWGPVGHRVVGDVAQKYLSSKVQKIVTELLDGQSLAQVSNWPDEIKSEPDVYAHTYVWHYTDWPDHQDHYEPSPTSGSLVKAIENNLEVYRNKKASKQERAFALKFLVHLVGDLHMPLHVGNGLDKGGNQCKVTFHKVESNLHKVWDEDMINQTRLSFTELSLFIDIISKQERQKIQQGTILDWTKESKELRNTVYPAEVVPAPIENAGASKNYCQKEYTGELPQLAYDYSYRFMPIVERRLLEAGLRLAMLLNEN
jgi:hypothetical protein